jgi:hypothetical protein
MTQSVNTGTSETFARELAPVLISLASSRSANRLVEICYSIERSQEFQSVPFKEELRVLFFIQLRTKVVSQSVVQRLVDYLHGNY